MRGWRVQFRLVHLFSAFGSWFFTARVALFCIHWRTTGKREVISYESGSDNEGRLVLRVIKSLCVKFEGRVN
ncbi:hypothetical protein D3C76_1494470 [compost metagenome]